MELFVARPPWPMSYFYPSGYGVHPLNLGGMPYGLAGLHDVDINLPSRSVAQGRVSRATENPPSSMAMEPTDDMPNCVTMPRAILSTC